MREPATHNLIKAKSSLEFLDLHGRNTFLYDTHRSFIFRGVADASYSLVPSALRGRHDGSFNKLLAEYELGVRQSDQRYEHCLVGIDDKLEFKEEQYVETMMLRMFYCEANRQGLGLPAVKQAIHDALSFGDLSTAVVESLYDELLPVFALAQHYGLPTRLLDWSYDFYTAAYFAASGGAQKLTSDNPPTHIGIWYFDALVLDDSVKLISAQYNGNPNLAAQNGVFTFAKNLFDETPLNVFAKPNQYLGSQENIFTLMTLPIEQAPCLLMELRKLGYSAARIFPGYGGIAESIKEHVSLLQFEQVPKNIVQSMQRTMPESHGRRR